MLSEGLYANALILALLTSDYITSSMLTLFTKHRH